MKQPDAQQLKIKDLRLITFNVKYSMYVYGVIMNQPRRIFTICT